MTDYRELLEEARDLLVLCTMFDKSDHCQNMVNKIDKALQQPVVMQRSEQLFAFLEYCDNVGWIKNIDKKSHN